jgi:hypothetical protein
MARARREACAAPDGDRRSCYRYRTRALVGAWRPTIGAAIDDAINAGQALADLSGRLHWRTPGEFEQGAGEA